MTEIHCSGPAQQHFSSHRHKSRVLRVTANPNWCFYSNILTDLGAKNVKFQRLGKVSLGRVYTTDNGPDSRLLIAELRSRGRGKQQRFFRMRNCSRWAESGVVHWDTGLAISCLGVAISYNGSRSETSVLWQQSWRWREWGDDQTETDIMESSETMAVIGGDIFDTHWGLRSLASLMWSCQMTWQYTMTSCHLGWMSLDLVEGRGRTSTEITSDYVKRSW